jgi:hypothetical protein
VDGPPTSDDGQCHGIAVFQIADGNLDDTDLSGVNLGLVNMFPSNLTSGNWKLGIDVDENASDEQASALEQIVKGEQGGVFEQFAALTDEWLGMERGPVTQSEGDKPSASIASNSVAFEPLPGPEGSNAETTVRNAVFGFAEEFRVGRAPGKVSVFGMDFETIYGESADYQFSSEQPEGAPTGRG